MSGVDDRTRPRPAPRPDDRIRPYLAPRPDGCCDWTGERYFDRAPKVHTPDGPRLVAQVVFELHGGRGRATTTCGYAHCLNPDHLAPTTPEPRPTKSPAKAKAPTPPKPAKPPATACFRGHPYEGNLVPANLRDGKRRCATCAADQRRLRTAALTTATRATGLSKADYVARFGASMWTAAEVIRRTQAGLPLDGITDPPRDAAAEQLLAAIADTHTPRADRTHCREGHELAGDNLAPWQLSQGRRVCRICETARRRAHRAKTRQHQEQR